MKDRTKNIRFVISVLLLVGLLIWEYLYVIPYHAGVLDAGDSPFTWLWFCILFGSIFMSLPLFYKRKIGFIGLILLAATIAKPILMPKVPRESSAHFFKERMQGMESFKNKHQQQAVDGANNKDLEQLGFEQYLVEGDTYMFVVHSMIDNGYGFCYDADGELPKSLMGSSVIFEKLSGNWYQFVIT